VRLSRRQSLARVLAAATVPPVLGARPDSSGRIRLVILDIGGTLIQDRGDVPEILRRSLAHHGIDSTLNEISRMRGASKREMIRHFVGPDRGTLVDTIYDEFTAGLIKAYRSVPPIAGAEDALGAMRQRDYLVATTTGFDRAITASIFGSDGTSTSP
jgi:phosphoglycolate phosphatase-like HAD superfamily hydrolase